MSNFLSLPVVSNKCPGAFFIIVLGAISIRAHAELALNVSSSEVQPGSAVKLVVKGVQPEIQWESSAPQIAEVFSNGFVVGLRPGETRIRARKADSKETAECLIKVNSNEQSLLNPATLKQYPDNREFVVSGRKCYGSELNGQRASDPDERRFTRSNRVINPRPLREDKPLLWQLQPETELYDGAGVLLGMVPPTLEIQGHRVPVSMFNFGASKVLHGAICVYAFSVSIKPSSAVEKMILETEKGGVATSAWLPLEAVLDKETLLERVGLGRSRPMALPLETTGYRVTGGNPGMYFTPFGEMGIVRQINGPVPSHYLRRPSGTINLVYSVPGFGLGGQGADSFLVSDGLMFYPARNAKEFRQPTYYPRNHPQAGKASPLTMTFLYGAIKGDGSEPAYGWIAKEALDFH